MEPERRIPRLREELQHEARQALIAHMGPALGTVRVRVRRSPLPLIWGCPSPRPRPSPAPSPARSSWPPTIPPQACRQTVLSEAGLKIQLHPNGTAIEGEWEPVFAAIEACHQAVHAMGCPRIYTTVKINTRTDKEQAMEDKMASVQALL
jgi:uncharacterized protein (TIGR00106 family)